MKKQQREEKEYSIGLDIGDASVGWSVIGNDYKVVRAKNKRMWGSILFPIGQSAESTRLLRGTRRRIERRKERIRLLQDLFGQSVLTQDDSFFIKLKESFLMTKDKDSITGRDNIYNLFCESDFTDVNFYDKYPTIYHLRRDLISNTEKVDARLVYLALHHIIKYRGNFLYDSDVAQCSNNLFEAISTFFDRIDEIIEEPISYEGLAEKIVEIVVDKNKYKSEKIESIITLFDKGQKDFAQNFAKAIIGYKFEFNKVLLCTNIVDEEKGKAISCSFSSSTYDEVESSILSILDDTKLELLKCLHDAHFALLFKEVTLDCQYISEAMIKRYEKHNSDLKLLKSIYKQISIAKYNEMFKSKEEKSYSAYAHTKDKIKKCSREDLYKKIKEDLMPYENIYGIKIVIDEINKDNFLPLINDVRNAAIPYQYNLKELVAIIENQSKFYPELFNNKDKIISLLTFRRPYYVGPLKNNGRFSWYNEKIDEKVYPWNYYELVNLEQAQELFITRMTNHCSIFPDEEVLPLHSILYEAFVCLNELNGLRINDKKISVNLKKDLFVNLFCKQKSVNKKDIRKYLLKVENISVMIDDITGISDEKFNGSMKTLIDFKRIIKDFSIEKIDMYDDIVRVLTIFDDSKTRKNRISKMGLGMSEEEITQLVKLNFSGWGKFSRKVIRGVYGKDRKTVIDYLFENNINFNEVRYSDSLGFAEILNPEKAKISRFSYKNDIESLYCSPAVKKGVWQTIKAVDEIVKIMGNNPKSIFIEITNEDNVKKRTNSRIDFIQEKYANIKDGNLDIIKQLKTELKGYGEKNNQLSDKLFLYFTQKAKCMYSNEALSIEHLNEYEIDHIIPRSYIKDDSIENKVLVKKIENQQKSGDLTISIDIIQKMQPYWKSLLDQGLIGLKKYNNLIRTEFTNTEISGFINRQLVETNQIVSVIRELIERKYDKTIVRGVKSQLSSNFRKKEREHSNNYGFYKIRELNDFHHAKDAYLAAVFGQFTTYAYPIWGQDSECLWYGNQINNANLTPKELSALVNKRYGIIIDAMEYADQKNFIDKKTGEVLFDSCMFTNILKQMANNDCQINFPTKYIANNEFYNMQMVKKGATCSKKMIKVKGKLIPLSYKLYGGYTNVNKSHYCLVEYLSKKNKIEKKIVGIPTIVSAQAVKDSSIIDQFIIEECDSTNVRILMPHICQNQLICYKGQYCLIRSDKELCNATQLIVDGKYEKLLYCIINCDKDTLISQFGGEDPLKCYLKEFIVHYCEKIDQHFPLLVSKIKIKAENFIGETYNNRTIEEICKYVKLLLIATHFGPGRVDIPAELGGGSSRLSGNIDVNEIIWISKSTTGIFVKKWN